MALKDVPGAADGLPSAQRITVLLQRFAERPVTVPPSGGTLYIDSDTPQTGSQPSLEQLSAEDQVAFGAHFEEGPSSDPTY